MLSLTLPAPLAAEALTTLDAHTEGEPLRIITGGYPPIPGSTILEKRRYLQAHLDHYRRLLMHEPRGHADMYGALLTEPTTLDGDFGVLFLHNEGYSSMCGHGILAVVQAAAKCGWFSVTAMPETINIDAPAGRIQAQVWRNGAGGIEASFINVPSWAEALDCRVEVPGLGTVGYDIGFGGAYYAYVDADALGLSCDPERLPTLISAGRAIKQAVMATHPLAHPQEADLSFLYGTLFTSARTRDPDCHSRHVCVFADGEVDRSPTGTGVAGRVALLHARNQVALGQPLMIESIVGGRMTVTATDAVDYHGKAALLPRVSGRSWITGEHTFVLEPDDPFSQGFLLR